MRISNIKTSHNPVENTNIVGQASCIINDIVAVNRISIRKAKDDNLYIQMPQMKNSATKQYQDIVFPITSEGRKQLNEDIIAAFTSNQQTVKQADTYQNDISINLYLNDKPETNILANGTMNINNELVIKNIRVITGNNNQPFISFPSVYNKNQQKSYSIVSPASKQAYSQLKDIVLAQFEQISNQGKRYYFAELDEQQIAIISENSKIQFDCVPNKENNDKFIVRFNANDEHTVDNILENANALSVQKRGD